MLQRNKSLTVLTGWNMAWDNSWEFDEQRNKNSKAWPVPPCNFRRNVPGKTNDMQASSACRFRLYSFVSHMPRGFHTSRPVKWNSSPHPAVATCSMLASPSPLPYLPRDFIFYLHFQECHEHGTRMAVPAHCAYLGFYWCLFLWGFVPRGFSAQLSSHQPFSGKSTNPWIVRCNNAKKPLRLHYWIGTYWHYFIEQTCVEKGWLFQRCYFHWPAEVEWIYSINFDAFVGLVSGLRLCFIHFPSFQFHRFLSSQHITLLGRRQSLYTLRHPKWGNSWEKMGNTNSKHLKMIWNCISQITHPIANLQRWA